MTKQGQLSNPGARLLLALLLVLAQAPAWAGVPAGSAPPPRGKLINIGGWKLHLYCTGKSKGNSPTVVFEAGAGGSSLDWALVQPGVAAFTRACSYDRAGTAWSELGPRPRTSRQAAYELRTLLAKAGIRGPYVLVGHSMGGPLVRIFAAQYPSDVAGMVLVDATSDDTRLVHAGKLMRLREDTTGQPIPPVRTTISAGEKHLSEEEQKAADEMLGRGPMQASGGKLTGGPPLGNYGPFRKLPPDIQKLRLWVLQQPGGAVDGSQYLGQELAELYTARQKEAHPLGDMPLVVLIAGQREELPDRPEFRPFRVPNEEVDQQDKEMASLSSRGRWLMAEHSGHAIQLDEPQIVVAAIHEVVDAARPRPARP